MTATDKKRRKLAMAIGESFAALRRRVVRSEAWCSLSAPALKVLVELRLRWRHKDGNNNGQLFVSLRECEKLLRLSRASAVRAFAELEAKGFIIKTRQGEAGRLPKSATLQNGGTGYGRQATTWALTDEPCNGQPPTYAFERWRAPDGSAGGSKKQFHVSAGGPLTGPLVDLLNDNGSARGPVEAGVSASDGSAGGPPISTIYRERSTAPAHGGVGRDSTAAPRPHRTRTASAKRTRGKRQKRAHRSSATAWPAGPRRDANLTQQELAKRAGLTRGFIASLEQGRCQPSASARERITRALNGGTAP